MKVKYTGDVNGNINTREGTFAVTRGGVYEVSDGVFKKLNKEGKTIIIVTHERYIAKMAKRLLTIKDGRIVSDTKI